MPRTHGKQALKYFDSAICAVARTAFNGIQYFNDKFQSGATFTPRWSEKPLLKSWEKTKPTLGWPRKTDSLCPGCVRDARERIINGEQDWKTLINEKVGEIPADIVFQDDTVTAFRDISPRAPVHILVVPNQVIPTIADATEADEPVLGHMMTVAAQLAESEGIAEDGYRPF